MTKGIEVKDTVNPFTSQIVAAAGRHAAAQKRHDQKRDTMWLAKADVSAVEREIRACPQTANGRAVPASLRRRHDNALEAFEGASGLYAEAARALESANGELVTAQKAAETWEARQAHFAREAEAEKDLTPRQRELRQLRELQDRLGVT